MDETTVMADIDAAMGVTGTLAEDCSVAHWLKVSERPLAPVARTPAMVRITTDDGEQ